jgi:ribosome-binding factor A
MSKSAKMESTRQKKVARLLQKELADLILHRSNELAPGKMISVTTVRVSPDLSLAKVYVSIFPSENATGALQALKDNASTLRYEMGKKVRNQLRIVPEVAFFIDDSNDYIENISNLLKD